MALGLGYIQDLEAAMLAYVENGSRFVLRQPVAGLVAIAPVVVLGIRWAGGGAERNSGGRAG